MIKIVFAGNSQISATTLKALVENGFNVELVISGVDKNIGRGNKLAKNPVVLAAEDLKLNLLQCESINQSAILDRLKSIAVDFFIVVSYGKILGARALAIPKYGCFNLHYSLLPKWRGASPIQSSLLAGDKVTGVSLFKMVAKMDAGPIAAQKSYSIPSLIVAQELEKNLCEIGIELLIQVLPNLASMEYKEQDENGVSFCGLLKTEDRKINWNEASDIIIQKWQAYAYKPGVFSFIDSNRLNLVEIARVTEDIKLNPGQILKLNNRFLIGTKTSPIAVIKCQLAGKKEIKGSEFINNLKNWQTVVLI